MNKNVKKSILEGSRVYLSGPMDFVASRKYEKEHGWRTRISRFLKSKGVTVFDPWEKPEVIGMPEYGNEDINTTDVRNEWDYGSSQKSSNKRANCADSFWPTMHIDLRMVDISDFIIAFCPTNIYSVGTVHEIVVARQQHKPVLFVSPPVVYPAIEKLRIKAKVDKELQNLLDDLEREIPVRENKKGIPSLWYMPLVGSENFFDGFGFNFPGYKETFGQEKLTSLDKIETDFPPERPLIKFLDDLSNGIMPERWNPQLKEFEVDDDWLLMEKVITR